jgi:hypothetical protein
MKAIYDNCTSRFGLSYYRCTHRQSAPPENLKFCFLGFLGPRGGKDVALAAA